jgi:mRNA interferase MazF
MSDDYIPQRGDYIFVNLDPTKGHEQQGYRPALVISHNAFNKHGICFICPITSKAKLRRPFTVASNVQGQEGTILIEHTRSIDWQARGIRYGGKASDDTLSQVQMILVALVAS